MTLLSGGSAVGARAATPYFVHPSWILDVEVGPSEPAFADIDGDGDLDALVGDGFGRTVFFANSGSTSVPAFAGPEVNPFGLASVGSWAAPDFVDIDGDGDLDGIVGEYSGNTLVFMNTGTKTLPDFAAPLTNPFGLADVGVGAAPDFTDVDGDGDLDAFVSDYYDHSTTFFANTGTATSPAFAGPQVDPFGLGPYALAPVLADIDDDGDLDAFVGDSFGGDGDTLFFLNTGTAGDPAFGVSQANPFGLARVGGRASPFLADIDADGDLDAFVGDARGITHSFKNTGTQAAPAFASPVPVNPFGLADVGSEASPAFADLDGDGDLDAFLASGSGELLFFANTGTVSAPGFALPATNPFGLSDVGSHVSLVFGDVDGDGALDAVVKEGGGVTFGTTFLFANTGTAMAPAFAAPASNPFGLVDVYGGKAVLADIDGDGDLDVFSGYALGLSFFENTGSPSAPSFAPPELNPFGLTPLTYPQSAFVDLDGDADLDAFLGDLSGNVSFLENTGTTISPAFASPIADPFGLRNVGPRLSPTLADIDGDGDLDAFLGVANGRTFFFEAVPPPVCNNGLVEPGEECDDGNGLNGDACDDDPTSDPPGNCTFSACGNGVVVGEECDDGNKLDGDGCSAQCQVVQVVECPTAPDPGCKASFASASLLVDERHPGREKLLAKLERGPALEGLDFGFPLSPNGAAYALCLYDQGGGLAGSLDVERAGAECGEKPCWKAVGPGVPSTRGYLYKDKAGDADGVRVLQLKAGAAGRSRIAVGASNREAKGQVALPTGIAASLQTATGATLQLQASDSGCFSAQLENVLKQENDLFKAK